MGDKDARTDPFRVRVALVGAGFIGDYHAAALRSTTGVETVAVCDLQEARARGLADRHQIASVYADLGEMLGRERLDCAHLLVPAEAHAALAQQLLDSGVDLLVEKPLSIDAGSARFLSARAADTGRALGVSHNFLFSPAYERLRMDLRSGRLGRPEEVEVVWSKFFAPARAGPFDLWVLRDPTRILLEVGPHSFAHLLDLMGDPETLAVKPSRPSALPGGVNFYRCWHLAGEVGGAHYSMRFSFNESYPEHRIQIHGQLASATVDFERDIYTLRRHRALGLDLDRFAAVVAEAGGAALQSGGTLARYALGKAGFPGAGTPYQRSITRAVRAFHGRSSRLLDDRLSTDLAVRVVCLAERAAAESGCASQLASRAQRTPRAASGGPPTVLVTGGTGFIGRALVRNLCEAGYRVRVLSRGQAPDELFGEHSVEVLRGVLSDPENCDRALDGIEHVFHLARGYGSTWEELERSDVIPTRDLAEAAERRGVKRFVYASSIALFDAGDRRSVILDDTPPDEAVVRSRAYARAKRECERQLREMHQRSGFGSVIVRPGIVLGSGGNPCHAGVGLWPFHSVCVVCGGGRTALPVVLVDDVAQAMRRCIEVEEAAGRCFNLVAESDLTAQDYLDELERAARYRLTRRNAPIWRLFLNDAFKWLAKTAVRQPGRIRPSYRVWRASTLAARFDCTGARQLLGWKPVEDREHLISEGIRKPVAEFLS